MVLIEEKDDGGYLRAVYILSDKGGGHFSIRDDGVGKPKSRDFVHLLQNMFLPAGYPASVSSDYLKHQVLNGLQAFCSSLAGLIASRAVLEGHGVGQAEASATNALLLTILQDIFSRLTTIGAAYYLGTSLSPEAKTYRLLADLFNDAALVLDTLSPHFSSFSIQLASNSWLPILLPTLVSRRGSLRGVALCLSGALRALCGLAAGGSKAALTLHFAQPDNGSSTGDISDLSAKDGSKETVLALVGMLCGTAVMPYVQGPYATYGLLALLVIAHIFLNYVAVRNVVLRSFNRQRTTILWDNYRSYESHTILSPQEVAAREQIFTLPSLLYRSTASGSPRVLGYCKVGSSLSLILPGLQSDGPPWLRFVLFHPRRNATWTQTFTPTISKSMLDLFATENYILWFDVYENRTCLQLHIILKQGHSSIDHTKAWLHALELAYSTSIDVLQANAETLLGRVRDSKTTVDAMFDGFMEAARSRSWDIDSAAGGFVVGLPRVVNIVEGSGLGSENKKRV